jgi:hypothetical protein
MLVIRTPRAPVAAVVVLAVINAREIRVCRGCPADVSVDAREAVDQQLLLSSAYRFSPRAWTV